MDEQISYPDSLLNYCKAINHARIDYPMFADGENEFLYAEGDILLMRRTLDENSCLIAMNFSAKETGQVSVPEGKTIARDIETGTVNTELAKKRLILPPYAVVILK